MMFRRLTTAILSMIGMVLLPSCATEGSPGVGLDLIAGVCVGSADGHYTACYNPFTKVATVKSTGADGHSTTLTYDAPSRTWRGTLPDGSTAVYVGGKLHLEPPLPSGK